jgi:hypothetical protein
MLDFSVSFFKLEPLLLENMSTASHDSHFPRCYTYTGGCCPDDPSQYSLTGTHLVIRTVQPQRCGPIRCCCVGVEYDVDNIDLTHVTDADVRGERAPCTQEICCCAKALDVINIKSTDGEKQIRLHMGEGEAVSRKILNQVEEAQKIERD